MDMEVRVLHIGGGLFDENIRCNSTAGEVLIAISAQHIQSTTLIQVQIDHTAQMCNAGASIFAFAFAFAFVSWIKYK